MGYTTEFLGSFSIDRPLDPELAKYLRQFLVIRHMKRDNQKIMELYPDWENYCFRNRLGVEGEYFVKEHPDDFFYEDTDILDRNNPSKNQPGLWCNWTVGENDNTIEWDGGEKFYDYKEWLEYLIKHFLAPSGYTVNGSVRFQGEDDCDSGFLIVDQNHVKMDYDT